MTVTVETRWPIGGSIDGCNVQRRTFCFCFGSREQVFPFVEKAAEKNEFVTSLLEAYLPVTILLIIINLLYFALKVCVMRGGFVFFCLFF